MHTLSPSPSPSVASLCPALLLCAALQAPSLECVFQQCYSVQAWLSLKSGNIAVIHCANGKSRTGILVACYLRYTGVVQRVSEGFDYFCKAR